MENIKKLLALLSLATLAVLFCAVCSTAAVVEETGGKFVRIILENRSEKAINAGIEWKGEWKRETRGDGVIKEISYDDYFEVLEKELSKQTKDNDVITLPDYPAPGGNIEFYFKGERPGMVELQISCSSPDRSDPYAEAKFKINVSSDLKIIILDSSVKYNWDD